MRPHMVRSKRQELAILRITLVKTEGRQNRNWRWLRGSERRRRSTNFSWYEDTSFFQAFGYSNHNLSKSGRSSTSASCGPTSCCKKARSRAKSSSQPTHYGGSLPHWLCTIRQQTTRCLPSSRLEHSASARRLFLILFFSPQYSGFRRARPPFLLCHVQKFFEVSCLIEGLCVVVL